MLAPLAAVPHGTSLESGVEAVLNATTVADARAVYRAIRLAQPGGMGSVPEQDIAAEPTLPLKAVMAMAADRDLVARQYANGFREVFGDALEALTASLGASRSVETSIVAAHLTVLSRHPDSLIVRKAGLEPAKEVSRRAGRSSTPAGRIARKPSGCAMPSTNGSAIQPAGTTPAPRPTWSRPPCTRPCEMGQFGYRSRHRRVE